MENCSRRNSRTVSRIQFKLGRGIEIQNVKWIQGQKVKNKGHNVT